MLLPWLWLLAMLGAVNPAGAAMPAPTAVYRMNQSGADGSGHGLNASVVGATLTADRFGVNSAYAFTGVAADPYPTYLTVPDAAALHFTNALTVAAWVKPTQLTGTIVDKWYSPDAFGLGFTGSNYVFNVRLSDGTLVSVAAPATAGLWTHVAGVFDGTSIKIYVNGVLMQTATALGSLTYSTMPLYIGHHPTWSAYQCAIDQVALYAGAATAAEVAAIMNEVDLAVTPSGTGSGSISSGGSPAHISCTSTAGTASGVCSSGESPGAVLTLTATPVSGSTFTGWGGACSGTGACTVTVKTTQNVTAGFQASVVDHFTPTSDFTLNSDGTVYHKLTGLTWKRCAEGRNWTGTTCSGTDATYTWDQAKALTSTFAGQSDWRLPTRWELATIVDYGIASPGPTINSTIFPSTSRIVFSLSDSTKLMKTMIN